MYSLNSHVHDLLHIASHETSSINSNNNRSCMNILLIVTTIVRGHIESVLLLDRGIASNCCIIYYYRNLHLLHGYTDIRIKVIGIITIITCTCLVCISYRSNVTNRVSIIHFDHVYILTL